MKTGDTGNGVKRLADRARQFTAIAAAVGVAIGALLWVQARFVTEPAIKVARHEIAAEADTLRAEIKAGDNGINRKIDSLRREIRGKKR